MESVAMVQYAIHDVPGVRSGIHDERKGRDSLLSECHQLKQKPARDRSHHAHGLAPHRKQIKPRD